MVIFENTAEVQPDWSALMMCPPPDLLIRWLLCRARVGGRVAGFPKAIITWSVVCCLFSGLLGMLVGGYTYVGSESRLKLQ